MIKSVENKLLYETTKDTIYIVRKFIGDPLEENRNNKYMVMQNEYNEEEINETKVFEKRKVSFNEKHKYSPKNTFSRNQFIIDSKSRTRAVFSQTSFWAL